jgi:MFS family permease
MTSTPEARPVAHPGLLILATGTMVMILSGLQTIVIPVIGNVAEQLGAPLDEVGWILTANLLGAAVSTPVIGRLGDQFGKRPVILAVLAVVAAGSLVAALTTSLGVLIAARVLQSTAYGLFPLAVGVLRDELPAARLLPGLALLSALLSIGGGAGLITTGVLAADGGDYRRIFWLSLVATVLPLVMCLFVLPRRRSTASGQPVDWWGSVLLGSTLVLVLLPLSKGSDWGWLSLRTAGCLVGALLAGWAFVSVERRRTAPLVSPQLLAYRPVWVTNVAAVFLGVAAFSSFLGVSQFVQQPRAGGYGFGATVLETSLVYLLPGTVAGVLLSPVTGRLLHRYGARPMLAGATVAGGASFLILAQFHQHPWHLIVTVSSVGNGIAFASIPALLVRYVDRSQTGVATGIASIGRSVGSSVASALAATLLASVLAQSTGRTSVVAYQVIFLVGAGSFLTITVLALVGLGPGAGRHREDMGPAEQEAPVAEPAEPRISATLRVGAPAGKIFDVITDPRGHVAIDGSGMLVAAPDARPVEAVGDRFLMDMDREPLGDLPLGRYQVENRVTRFEPGRALEWTVGAPGRTPLGHVYGYRLQPVGEHETDVTSYCDWSGLSEKWLARTTWPVVPASALQQSLQKLERLVTQEPAL